MKRKKKTRPRGAIVFADDLEVGQHYCVLGLKNRQPTEIAGMAFRLTAVRLPFLVGKLVAEPRHPPITLDWRCLTFVKTPDSYVQAQRPDAPEMS